MIKLDDNQYFGEVLLRNNASESLRSARLAKNIWIGEQQVVKTFIPGNMNDHLMTIQGSPEYNVGSGNSIRFTQDYDVIYMKSGVSCRNISGDLRGINNTYDSRTTQGKYVLICNFTGPVSSYIVLTKRSYGTYEKEYLLSIGCGENYESWTFTNITTGSFSIEYNGSAYVAKFIQRYVAESRTCSVKSQICREQVSRLELGGSRDTYNTDLYCGIHNMIGTVTTGMARM